MDGAVAVGGADGVVLGGGSLVVLAGPCVIEGLDSTLRIAEGLARACEAQGVGLVFKASFDKANRTSHRSYRGPGLDGGLEVLRQVKAQLGLPLTTDIHEPGQAAAVAQVVDLMQVPAFLVRQTDLVAAAAATGRPVNLKKSQLMAPADMAHAIDKARHAGSGGVVVTERGTAHGYHDLVVDMRAFPLLRALGVPVVHDATHAMQAPGGAGDRSGGTRHLALPVACAAVAAGADAVFAEVHEDPARALSDAAVQLALADFPAFLARIGAIFAAVSIGTVQDRRPGEPLPQETP